MRNAYRLQNLEAECQRLEALQLEADIHRDAGQITSRNHAERSRIIQEMLRTRREEIEADRIAKWRRETQDGSEQMELALE